MVFDGVCDNKIKYLFIFFILAVKLKVLANDDILEQINSNNDRGFWFEQNIKKNTSNDGFIRFRCEQRWASDYRQLYYQEYEIHLQYDIKKSLSKKIASLFMSTTMGPSYNVTRLIQRNTLGIFHWVWLQKPMLEINLGSSFLGWVINQRIRGEYIAFTKKHYKNHGVARYRLEFYSPWKWTSWKINPYLSNEWFFRENTYHSISNPHGLVGGWHENRFRAGINLTLFKQLSTAIYWQWLIRKQKPGTYPKWFNNYMVSCAINFNF